LAAPFQPIRILNLLPLSHMFGQSMSLFIPSLLGGSCLFVSGAGINSSVDAIRRERVSVLVCVPRLLTQLADSLQHRLDLSKRRIRTSGVLGVAERWWKYREVHKLFGMKFWAVVVGGAHLNQDLESFWTRLGYLVIQGYGLTEASPIVALNHPFEKRRGSIGRALPGQEVRLGEDGEILVRGANIVTEYLRKGEASGAPQTVPAGDEWLHTGDIGTIDEDGYLYFKARKGDVIVTPDGMNVYPEDLERILNGFAEIEASTIIGLKQAGQNTVHAVLISSGDSCNFADTIRKANQTLEPHQRIKAWTVWPESDFPRTSSTLKIKRAAVAERVVELRRAHSGQPVEEQTTTDRIKLALAQITSRKAVEIEESDRLAEDLGLSSLDRVDLLSKLEQQYGLLLVEAGFAGLTTVAQLRAWFDRSAPAKSPTNVRPSEKRPLHERPYFPPRWTLRFPLAAVRHSVRSLVTLPLFEHYMSLEVIGKEQLLNIKPPVIFAANHASNLDTIALLAALPKSWRPRIAPAIRLEYFEAHFRPDRFPTSKRMRSTAEYLLAGVLFNTYPVPQRSAGVRDFIRYAGELADMGYSTLLFPEGERTEDGTLKPFRPGLGLLAKNLKVPIVPIYIHGTYEIMSMHESWPKPGSVQIHFGPAFHPDAKQTPEEITAQVFAEIKRISGS
jgi:long-chain acyl-CoA synthetase